MLKRKNRLISPRDFIEIKGVGYEFSAYTLAEDMGDYTAPQLTAQLSHLSALGMIRHVGYEKNSIAGVAGRPYNRYRVVKIVPKKKGGPVKKNKVAASPVRHIPVESYNGPYKISIDEMCNLAPSREYVHVDEHRQMGPTYKVAPVTPPVVTRAPERIDVVPVPEAETLPVADHLRLMNNMLDFLTSYEVLVNENKALRERLSRYEQP